MSGPRIYTPEPLTENTTVALDDQAVTHLVRVLRMKEGDDLRLFNGDGSEYQAQLIIESKKSASASVTHVIRQDAPLKLEIHLGQVISKGDRMDFTIQKATELGVTDITPLTSERCDVRLKGDRMEKKLEHWQKVAISACEQSGRNTVPVIHPPKSLSDWSTDTDADRKLLLHPHNQKPLESEVSSGQSPQSIALLVGPEGGFSDIEVTQCQESGFDGLLLGPRILRTETAALTALSVLQYVWGDFR
ncbi:MAG: 16S rRNA (uracil(1498)-N(3))-methyltransferase [Oceanospirillaceae bacterium]|nr:16S rRNA (uracil(1498)-N(3))-methyltransferase [Thalassolituus sp. UBA3500]MBN59576.1 16S rRNA (uracil(1498)-N(3))-methyltransferase [Oceanospirillaceae bacterium]